MTAEQLAKYAGSLAHYLEPLSPEDRNKVVRAALALLGGGSEPGARRPVPPSIPAIKHGKRSLDDATVIEAREEYYSRRASVAEIAQRLNQSRQSAYLMLRGRTYAHLPLPESAK